MRHLDEAGEIVNCCSIDSTLGNASNYNNGVAKMTEIVQ